MRTVLSILCFFIACTAFAQNECGHPLYLEQQKQLHPEVSARMNEVENFILHQTPAAVKTDGEASSVIRIPVVVHILYRTVAENIPDAQVLAQIDALNRDFRKRNADTVNIPSVFKSRAADVGIEFQLATVDPFGKATTGIVRKQVNRLAWGMDDAIKLSSRGGDNAWDTRNYLNIWVGNLAAIAGYASFPGNDPAVDGIVVTSSVFGPNASSKYGMARAAVHEVGHWLGLKHIWGDSYCGDDLVDDTPKQGNYTNGCPTTFRSTCSNTTGDMYNNYMDYTNDACTNMFTEGQKMRMLALFAAGGVRNSLLQSKALGQPWAVETPTVEVITKPEFFRVFPNPAKAQVVFSVEHDHSWIGQTLYITRANGIPVMQVKITTVNQTVDISGLQAGVYFIRGDFGKKWISRKLIRL